MSTGPPVYADTSFIAGRTIVLIAENLELKGSTTTERPLDC